MIGEEQERLRSMDLQKLVDECRRCHNLLAIQARVASNETRSSNVDDMPPLQTLLAAIQARTADPQTWTASSLNPVLADDLLPIGLASQQQQIDFSILPPSLLIQVRQSVLQGLRRLIDTILESTCKDLVLTLSRLFSMQLLRPTNTNNADLKPALQQTFLYLLDTFHRLPNSSACTPTTLLSQVLAYMNHASGSDALVDLVGELVGLCGQQMSSDPTVLTETQDSTLVSTASFLSLCYTLNSSRPAATRLPAHAFYCTVLDLAPFLEHFVHHSASLVRGATATPAVGMARFNVCRWPFLLSLGAKVRILQLENELRLARTPPRDSLSIQRFALQSAGETDAELVGEYIWKSIIASFIGNIIGAALLALPLVYLHGGDEWDPSQGARAELPMHGKAGEGSSGASVNNVTLQASPQKWTKDVESQVAQA